MTDQPWNEMLEVNDNAWNMANLSEHLNRDDHDPIEDTDMTMEEYQDWIIDWTSFTDVYKERQLIRESIEYMRDNYDSFTHSHVLGLQVNPPDEEPALEEVKSVFTSMADPDNPDAWIEYHTLEYSPVEYNHD